MDKPSFSEKLQAFIRYKERGIEAVSKIYPDCLEFIINNKDKTYSEVKAMLIGEHNEPKNPRQL